MVNNIITPETKHNENISNGLFVSELFSDTIQGEGPSTGHPAVFLRLGTCCLNCSWCDTKDIWKKGKVYSIDNLIEIFEESGIVDKLIAGHILVITGGSPLLQQEQLIKFLKGLLFSIRVDYNNKPFEIEIENECVIIPSNELKSLVTRWNNSPKLKNSGNPRNIRYKPELIKHMSLYNSIFKFVITCEDDWTEIKKDFLERRIISKNQIYLMPEGQTRKEIQANYQKVIDICVREDVKFSDRLHVTIWDNKKGV